MNPVYSEIVEFIAGGPSQQAVADFQASDAAKARVEDLICRAKTTELNEVEKAEFGEYMQMEHLMRMVKATARQRMEQQ